jgi:signal transduction histidine kinase
MKTRSFRFKLWVYFAVFTAFIFIILWLMQTVFLQSFYNDMLISDTKKVAEKIRSHGTDADIEKKIDELARDNTVIILITDESGKLLYSSDEFKGMHSKVKIPGNAEIEDKNRKNEFAGLPEPPKEKKNDFGKRMDEYRNLPDNYNEILSLLKASDEGYIESTEDDYYVYVTYVDYNGQDGKSVLYISTPLEAQGSAVNILRRILVWVTVLSLAAGFILSWFIARKFSKPVQRLSEKADKLGEKEYSEAYDSGFCSELDSLNQTLDRTNEKLNTSKEFQMQLLSNVSHDLRTPLTMIKGYAEMIRDISWEDSEAMSSDLQVIIKEADRLNALVNEILEYSELQTEDDTKDMEQLDLSELVKSSAERFEKLLQPENVVIEKDIDLGLTATGNPGLLERALYNLMDNAVRHTGDGKKIRVALKQKDGIKVISVQDFGNGIAPEEIDHIWDRYYTSRQRKGKGVSGLGLAIVKQIALKHRGKCYAESKEGEGCTFFIEIV